MCKVVLWLTVLVTAGVLVFLAACGGGGSTTKSSNQLGTVSVSVSDPPTCGAAQGGDFAAVYVAIQDVQINTSATAGDNDSSWVDLTPNLKSGAPKQINLLGIANNQCFLATLNEGSGLSIQPGTYQQIRIMLAGNQTTLPSGQDHCLGVGANCVILNSDPTKAYPLQLSSEATTGLKIPSGQIAGGSFVVAAGETKDLNIDFNTCASIVRQGNNRFRLKPVLHAGEVKLTSTSINGTLIDADTNQPINSTNAVVLLEKNDGSGTDSLYMEAKPNNLGQFNFCPVPDGTYDLVVAVMNSDGTKSYSTTIVSGVQPGNAVGNVKMFAQSVTGVVSQAPASITGLVTTTSGASATDSGAAGIAEDITVRAQQLVALSANTKVIVPLALQSASGLNFTVADAAACPTTLKNSFCGNYTIVVPASNPTVGAFAASGTTFTPNTTTPVAYTVDASTSGCTPSEQTTSQLFAGGPLQVSAGQIATVTTLNFTNCK